MTDLPPESNESVGSPKPHRRRPRYSGKYPKCFAEKYKEHRPEQYPETIAKVLASGKTPAGTHRPIMVHEILEVLGPKPGELAVDCTLGYGGHAEAILPRLNPGGRLLGLDADPLELPRTEARLRSLGFGPEVLTVRRSNFAGLQQALAALGVSTANVVLADLGVSSMQLDDPSRGFSFKAEGPLDMRMNPQRGQPASELVARLGPAALADVLRENADEPRSAILGGVLAGQRLATTLELASAVRSALRSIGREEKELTVRRVFQALRVAVNEEYSALETFLRILPLCLAPGGRVAILTFHSGEDRRVKSAFGAGLRQRVYAVVGADVIRASAQERLANPRAGSAKLRWARRAE